MTPGRLRLGSALLQGMVLVAALLSFGMEPIVGRLVTPWFGSAVHVWTTCLMTFQVLLLAGYAYAHLLGRFVGAGHLAVVALPLLLLPLDLTAARDHDAPLAVLLAALLRDVSLPFTVLCTTSVIAQVWHQASPLGGREEPYRLYAWSNVGSLVALFGYPLLVEPFFGVRAQRLAWSGLYVAWVLLVVGAWWVLRPAPRRELGRIARVPMGTLSSWVLLSAAPSALLLGVTNMIATEVGSFPLVWVVPLALYLSTFILAFAGRGGWLLRWWPDLCLAALGVYVMPPYPAMLVASCGALFLLSTAAHAALYARRPEPEHLTTYYLAISTGGALGGAAVTLLAPVLFTSLTEVPLAIVSLGVALWLAIGMPSSRWWKEAAPAAGAARLAWDMVAVTLLLLGTKLAVEQQALYRFRNFYGIYRVDEAQDELGAYRRLAHGSTAHGVQYRGGALRGEPQLYYTRGGAIGQVFAQRRRPTDLAVVGLGIGSVSVYPEPGERLVYYEIDPDNERIARDWFTHLGDAVAPVEVRVGDARLRLADEAATERYGLLLVDAFSGDGIPTHLVTREALDVYLSRLAPDGLLAFHISNRFYDLRPVLASHARALGLHAAFGVSPDDGRPHDSPAEVVVLVRDADRLAPFLAAGWTPLDEAAGGREVAWTDDFVHILATLR